MTAQQTQRTYLRLLVTAASSAAAGAVLMYYLDPRRGRQRRAWLRQGIQGRYHAAVRHFRKTAEYSLDRIAGKAAEFRSHIAGDEADDVTLVDRVRASLGRAVSHPGAIVVIVSAGVAILRGPILAAEVDALLTAVRRVRGIREVRSELEVHSESGDIPALQGTGRHSHA